MVVAFNSNISNVNYHANAIKIAGKYSSVGKLLTSFFIENLVSNYIFFWNQCTYWINKSDSLTMDDLYISQVRNET